MSSDELIESLEILRQHLCPYWSPFGPDTCDCKFGASLKGEETGCPELRAAIQELRQRDVAGAHMIALVQDAQAALHGEPTTDVLEVLLEEEQQ